MGTTKDNLILQKKVDEDTSKYLKDKKIILVGPAPYLENKGLGSEIDSFDCVIRQKNGFPVHKDMEKDFGCRTDIYYTNLKFNQHSFGQETYRKMNSLRMIIVPYPIKDSNKRIFKLLRLNYDRFLREIKSFQPDFCVPIKSDLDVGFFNNLQRLVGTRPTTGLLAIMDLLQYPIKELHIKGLTFRHNLLELQTRYRAGDIDSDKINEELSKIYCNKYKNKKQLRYSWKRTLKNNLHNIEKELIFFKNLIKLDNRIIIDDHMKTIFNDSN